MTPETILRDFDLKRATWALMSDAWMRNESPWDAIAEVRRLGLDVTTAGETWRKLEAEVGG